MPPGQRWRCEGPATLRAGLDRLSKRVGRLSAGEVILALETVEYEGCVRVRCSRGWVGLATRAGRVKLVQADREVSRLVDTRRVMPGVTVSYAQKVTEGTDDLFDDELERAESLLALRGCDGEVCKAVCAALLSEGVAAATLSEHLKAMDDAALKRKIADATTEVSERKAVDGRLEEASELMLGGDYDGALRIYNAVLDGAPGHEEAGRGAAEAKKGQRFMAMVASGGEALMAQMGGMEEEEGEGADPITAAYDSAGGIPEMDAPPPVLEPAPEPEPEPAPPFGFGAGEGAGAVTASSILAGVAAAQRAPPPQEEERPVAAGII